MRILVAMPPFETFSPSVGGAVSSVAEGLGRAWSASGYDVHVTTPPADELHRTVDTFLVDFPRRGTGSWGLRAVAKLEGKARRFDWPGYRIYVREVQRAVRAVRPDVLILHNDLVLPRLRLPIPADRVVLHLHNQVNVKRPERARQVLQRVRGAVAVSDFIAEDARQTYAVDNVRTIHNGVDLAAFRRPRPPRLPGSPLRVAFLGRLLLAKGAHVLLEAAGRLADEGRPLDVTVIGSPTFDRFADHGTDPYVVRITSQVERLGARYVPHVDRTSVSRLLAEQDVVVVPSLFPDPFPLVVYEAMAAGCAVVASDLGGLPESVADAGMLFRPGDVDHLAARLRTLRDDPAALASCQTRGQQRVASRDWERVAPVWTPLLDPS